jgi:hypothetical protein
MICAIYHAQGGKLLDNKDVQKEKVSSWWVEPGWSIKIPTPPRRLFICSMACHDPEPKELAIEMGYPNAEPQLILNPPKEY